MITYKNTSVSIVLTFIAIITVSTLKLDVFASTNTPNYVNEFGMEFNYIPAGTILIGSSRPNQKFQVKPLHRTTIRRGFQIMTTEVTQKHWQSIMGYNPSILSSCGEDCPVENVTFKEISTFIEKLNAIDSNCVYRLPTEIEWEYASRAGTVTNFHWGNLAACEMANYGFVTSIVCDGCEGVETCLSTNPGRTLPVASYQPNLWGIYDMIGNVSEICVNSSNTSEKEIWRRGGNFYSFGSDLDSGSRVIFTPDSSRSFIGFRLVRINYPEYQEEPKLDFKKYKKMVGEQEKELNRISSEKEKNKTIFNMIDEKLLHQLTKALQIDPTLIETRSRMGNTALIYAAYKGDENIVNFLLQKNANPNSKGNLGNTALHKAVQYSRYSIVKTLISRGASLDIQNSSANDNISIGAGTPLHVAVKRKNPRMCQILLDEGADINTKNFSGNSALHISAGEQIIFELLLDYGADITLKNNNGLTPIELALDLGKREKIKRILKKRKISFSYKKVRVGELNSIISDFRGKKRQTSIQKAKEFIEEHPNLVHQSDIDGMTPLHSASFFGLDEIVEFLIEKGADTNSFNSYGKAPIHVTNRASIISLLLKHGAEVDLKSADGKTPLHKAVLRNDEELTSILLEAGATVNAVTLEGYTSIMIAKEKHFDSLLQLLLKY